MPNAKRSKIVAALMQGALEAARSGAGPGLDGKRVLIADEEAWGLDRLCEILRRIGGDDLDISTARGFNAALDIFLSHEGDFDIILISANLGRGRSGLDLLRQLRRAGLQRSAVALLYSPDMSPALAKAAKAAGFHDALHTVELEPGLLGDLLVEPSNTPSQPGSG